MVSVVQREWAAKSPRATYKTPITVEDVLNSRMIAYPFGLLQGRTRRLIASLLATPPLSVM
jgi:acetyl-CoA acetyltransferase